jgi:hypothetical protein
MGDLVSVAAPIIGAASGVPGGAQIGAAIGGALAGGQQVQQANQQLGQAAQMSQFRPVGITNTFGTSNFGFDDQGRLSSAGYTLSPQLQAYQDQLAGMTGQGLTAGQGLMSLGQQYLGESPEAVRQRYMQQQNALLAPENEQTLAGIRNKLFQTGRGGLATGATEAGNLAATNPEMAAYYNALAKQQAQLAAGAEQASQNQIKFGTGLLSGAYDPFKAGLTTQAAVEELGQQPLTLGSQLGGMSTVGSGNAAKYLSQQANPWSTATSNLLGNQQFVQGLGGLFGGSNVPSWTTGSDVFPESTFSGSGDASWMSDYWM